ncbi:MAG: DUF4136 domain-containing protein [Cytophagaceae bacterium]|nr:DUF4136 domain-containing protein [Cytophagaceae bacterium]
MRKIYLWVFVLMGGVLGGCSGTRVHTDKVKGADLSSYKTYAWLSDVDQTTDEDYKVVISDITFQNLRQTADEEMRKRGYVLNTENPDMLLRLKTNLEKKQEIVSSMGNGYSYNYWGINASPYYYPNYYSGFYNGYYSGYYNTPYNFGYGMNKVEYTEGTITIEAFDRRSDQMVWRGWSEEIMDDYTDVDEMDESVAEIFDDYPVKERKN